MKIDDGGWETYPGGATINSTQNVIIGNKGNEFVTIGWVGAPTADFNGQKALTWPLIWSKAIFSTSTSTGGGPTLSGGSVMISSSDKTWVTGTFTVEPAGWINTGVIPAKQGVSQIRGVFRVGPVN